MRRLRALGLGASLLLAGVPLARGDEGAVGWVGEHAIGAGELSRRLASTPDFQLATFGESPLQQRRGYLERVVAAERRLELEAARLSLAAEARVRDRVRALLGDALVTEFERAAESRVTREDLERGYAEHQARYAAPRRLRLFRILLEDDEQARRLIAEATGPKALERWAEQARKLSLDKATAMRRGDLGMVHPDGRTDVPTVRVDPALFAAADGVRDGEIVPTPVKEGERLAVVWRRGSLPARQESLQELEPTLRRLIVREQVTRAVAKLLTELRASHGVHMDAALIDTLPTTPPSPLRPFLASSAAPPPPPGRPAPSPNDRGLR